VEDAEDNEVALHDRLQFFNYAIVGRKIVLIIFPNESEEFSAVDP